MTQESKKGCTRDTSWTNNKNKEIIPSELLIARNK